MVLYIFSRLQYQPQQRFEINTANLTFSGKVTMCVGENAPLRIQPKHDINNLLTFTIVT